MLSLMLFELRRAQNCVLDRVRVTPFPHIRSDPLLARTSRVFLIKQYTKLANRAAHCPTSQSQMSQLKQEPDQEAEHQVGQHRSTDLNTGLGIGEPGPPLTQALGITTAVPTG